jgi:hypothetical protein
MKKALEDAKVTTSIPLGRALTLHYLGDITTKAPTNPPQLRPLVVEIRRWEYFKELYLDIIILTNSS